MRPTKHPEYSPVFEQLLRKQREQSKRTVSEAQRRVTSAKIAVQKSEELLQHARQLRRA